jgi:hypothetical protein
MLDNRGKAAHQESMLKTIDSALFSSYHRRIAVYFTSALGIPIDIIFNTFSGFWSDPLILIGLYSISFIVIGIISVLFARIRDSKLGISEKT